MSTSPRPGTVFGGFEITAELGRGASGIVYAATQLDLGREVALKLLSPELVDDASQLRRFQREARALARIDSPHVLGVHAAGVEDGRPWIATPLLRDGSLTDLLAAGPLDIAAATELVAQVAAGVAAAHVVGVLHRDIKPSNVLIRRLPDGLQAVICDLGLAHDIGVEHTRTGGVIGTWAYLAPERLEGAEASVASDVYALGCLLHAVLTGHAPYGGTEAQIAVGHLQRPIPDLPPERATPALAQVLQLTMAKRPGERYPTATAVADALRAAPTATPTRFPRAAARPPRPLLAAPAPRRPSGPAPRRPAAVVGVLGLAAASVVISALVLDRDESTPEVRPAAGSVTTSGSASVGPGPGPGALVSGPIGAGIDVEVDGTLTPGSVTLVAGTGPMLAAGQRALIHLWTGDAAGDVATDSYRDHRPAVVLVADDQAPSYLGPLVGATVGSRIQVVDPAPTSGEPALVVVDVLGAVLEAPAGEQVRPPAWVPLTRLDAAGRIAGFSFRPTDSGPRRPRIAYVVRGSGPVVAAGHDLVLRTLTQEIFAAAPTGDPGVPSAVSLQAPDAPAYLTLLTGVRVGSQVVIELPATADARGTIMLVDVLGAG